MRSEQPSVRPVSSGLVDRRRYEPTSSAAGAELMTENQPRLIELSHA